MTCALLPKLTNYSAYMYNMQGLYTIHAHSSVPVRNMATQWSKNYIDVSTFCDDPSITLPLLARLPPRPNCHNDVTINDDVTSYLLYAVRRCEKVSAEGLAWQDKELRPSGQEFLIPNSYTGMWTGDEGGGGQRGSHLMGLY